MHLIVAGIHTGIGKTVCSAILVEALGYSYWKPVQAGDLNHTDSSFVSQMTSPNTTVHSEAYRLQLAASPHIAAAQENLVIVKEKLSLPDSSTPIIIETAGGVMSPLSEEWLNIDLIEHLGFPVVLVSQDYLGSINHTVLSIEALKQRKIPLAGIVFCGNEVASTRKFILQYSGVPLLLTIPFFPELSQEVIVNFAAQKRASLQQQLYDLTRER